MSEYLRFIASHVGQLVHIDDKSKWRGITTTSIIVPDNITLAGFVVQSIERLEFDDLFSIMLLKFKVLGMNILSAKIFKVETWICTYLFAKKQLFMLLVLFDNPSGLTFHQRAVFANWSRTYFIRDRHKIITNNNAKSLNSMLRYPHLTITCLVEHIHSMMTVAQMQNVVAFWLSLMENKLSTTLQSDFIDNLTQVCILSDINTIHFLKNICACPECNWIACLVLILLVPLVWEECHCTAYTLLTT